MAYDVELEHAIDQVGRTRLFMLATSLGWTPTFPPPKQTWWLMISELRRADEAADILALRL